VVALATSLRDDGFALEHVDIGGGLGISYDGNPVPTAADYAGAVVPILLGSGFSLVTEPGRLLVGRAGTLLTRVVDLKAYGDGPRFAVLDAGMSELLRPALYGAFHHIEAVQPRNGDSERYEIVGPICESSDIFGRDRLLSPLEVGDLVAICDAGAYGSVMASGYNRHPLPPEVLVDGDAWHIIRRRQTVDDMLMLEL
jgi:diaminopimelate decarboxylase